MAASWVVLNPPISVTLKAVSSVLLNPCIAVAVMAPNCADDKASMAPVSSVALVPSPATSADVRPGIPEGERARNLRLRQAEYRRAAQAPHLAGVERRHGGGGEADDVGAGEAGNIGGGKAGDVGGDERRHLIRGERPDLDRAEPPTWVELSAVIWSVVRPAMAAVPIARIWAELSLPSAAVLSAAT